MIWGVEDVEDVMVLICGHGERDKRCGVMGPVLREEFEVGLGREGFEVLKGPVECEHGVEGEDGERLVSEEEGKSKKKLTAKVGLISHIGGHKFAGNVIVYIPPSQRGGDGNIHPLAGSGIWYGRVEPRHVEGILKETLREGRVVNDMFRGGINREGELLRFD